MNKKISFRKKTFSGALWTLLDKAASQIVNLLVMIILARHLGPSDFGLIGMLLIFFVLSNTIINGGFTFALIQKQNKKEIDYSTAFICNIAMSLIIYAILFFSAPYIASFYQEPKLIGISRTYFIILLIDSLSLISRAKATNDLNFAIMTKIRLCAMLFSSSIAILFAINGAGVWAIVAKVIVFSTVNLILLTYFIHPIKNIRFSFVSFKSLFSFGSKLMVTQIASNIVNNLQVAFIGKSFSLTEAGYYTQSMNITNIMSTALTEVTNTVTFPVLSKVQTDVDRLIKIYKKIIKTTAFIAFPAMVGFSLVAEPFVRLFFSEKWLPSVPIIQVLSLAAVFLPISAINLNLLNAIGRSDLFMKADFIKLPITLGILIFSIQYGVLGVAIGVLLSRFIEFYINCYYSKKLFDYGFLKQLIEVRYIIVSVSIMAISIFSVDYSGIYSDIYLLMVKILIGGIAYLLSSTIFRVNPLR